MAFMTDPTEPVPTAPGAAAPPSEPAPPVAPAVAPASAPPPDLGDRMKALGDELGTRGQQLGREAQAAGDRWSRDPGVVRVADTASRFWGLLLLLAGLWFAAQVTFGYALPILPWGELWPILIIALGLLVIVRGMNRRS
jgi:hypothetical protein